MLHLVTWLPTILALHIFCYYFGFYFTGKDEHSDATLTLIVTPILLWKKNSWLVFA